MDHYEFEQKLKAYIKEDGRSQAAVARKLGYPPDTFNKWVRFVNRMPDTAIYEFCELLGLDDQQRAELLTLAGYAAPPELQQPETVEPTAVAAIQFRPPLQRPPQAVHFMDRKEALAQLLEDLQPGKVVTLCGPGGIGKTALAAKVIWTLAPDDMPPELFPDGILFHSFYNQPQADLALEAIARSFGEEPKPTPVAAAQRALAGRKALLILDGAEDADDLERVLSVRDQCAVLITSRQHKDAVAQWQDMQPLPEDDAVALLQAWAGEWAEDEDASRQICLLIGALPLAVRLAGRSLAEEGWSAPEYLEWLEETPLAVLDQGQRRLESVPLLLERSVAQVSEQARQTLGVVGLLAFAPFDRDIISISLGQKSSFMMMKSLGELVNYGLIVMRGQNYEVTHALIHTYASEKLPPATDTVTKLAEHYISAFSEGHEKPALLKVGHPHVLVLLRICVERELWPTVAELASSIDNYLDLQGYWIDRIEVSNLSLSAAEAIQNRSAEAQCFGRLGDTYHNIGEYKQSTGYYQQALEIADEIDDLYNKSRVLSGLANVHQALGEYQQALDYYQQGLEIAEANDDLENERRHLSGLGAVSYYQGDYDSSLKYYQRALSIAQDIGDKQYEGSLLGGIGNVHHATGNYQQAIIDFQQALDISNSTGDRRNVATWSGNLGNVHLALGDSQMAIEYYQKALEISKSIGDRQREGFWLGKLGNVFAMYLMQYEEAIEYHKRALDITQTIGDRRTESMQFGSLGQINRLRGKNEQALKHYQQALDIAKAISEQERICGCLLNIGQIYSEDLGEYDKSLGCVQEALKISKDIGSLPLECSCLINLGGLYIQLGLYEKALSQYQLGMEIAKKIGARESVGVCNGNMGTIYSSLGEHEKGIHHYKQALAIAREIGVRRSQGVWLGKIGSTYNRMNQTDTAITYLNQALAIAQDIGHRRYESANLGELGVAYAELEQYELAMGYVEQGLQIARDIKDPFREANRLSELGIIYKKLNQSRQAKEYWEQSLRIFEEINASSAVDNIRESLKELDE